MTRRQRQLDELRALCRAGRVARAVDLAFEHVACFGRADQVVALLRDAIGDLPVAPPIGARLGELAQVAGEPRPSPPGPPPVRHG